MRNCTNKRRNTPQIVRAVLLLVLVVLGWSQTGAQEVLRYEASVDCMGGVFTVTAYGKNRTQLEAAVTESLEEAKRIDGLLSNYKRDSEWSKVNQLAGQGPVAVSEELYQLLEKCLKYSRLSEGTFDITVGPLMRRWGFFKGSGRFPHRSELRVAMAAVGYQNISLDRKAQTVRFLNPSTEMDPGGVGKGYAVDRMIGVLRDAGITSAFITAAGSSMYALGTPPGEAGWPVSIRHPHYKDRIVAKLTLKDQSMATSGSSEKFFMAGGKIYSHIMDPRNGYPAEGALAVSVVSPKALDTEVWAKPIYILGRDWAARHKPKGMRVFHCPSGPPGRQWETTCDWLQ
ncbi:MAG: FAD:protein FMN transferase [Acidobacteria bacterium]|nr:FAD:protein FMN transferase [Acidobacteriota bacterium]